MSVLLIGTFMTVEWAVGSWLVTVGHVTSTAVAIVLALGLGFSVRFVHGRVDHTVDRLFFRKRHQQEKALLQFAREAAFITDAETLLERTVAEIAERVQASSVAILTDDRAGRFVPARSLPGVPPRSTATTRRWSPCGPRRQSSTSTSAPARCTASTPSR